MKKIIILANLAANGGVFTWLTQLLKGTHQDVKFAIISHSFTNESQKQMSKFSNVELRSMPILSLKKFLGLNELWRFIHQWKPDHIVCNEFFFALSPAILRHLFPNIQLSIVIHGLIYEFQTQYQFKYKVVEYFLRYLLKSEDVIVTVSPYVKQEIEKRRRFKNKIVVIPNGIERNPQHCHHERKEKISKILFLGRLSIEKGPDRYLKLAKSLNNTMLQFYLAGEGPMQKDLANHVQEHALNNVTFLGWVQTSSTFWSRFDALVVTSRSEASPYAVIEAIQYQVPVVSLDVGGVSYLLQNGKNGYLCDSLSEIADLLDHASQKGLPDVEKHITQALNFLHQELTLEKMIERYQKLWGI